MTAAAFTDIQPCILQGYLMDSFHLKQNIKVTGCKNQNNELKEAKNLELQNCRTTSLLHIMI